MVTNPGGVFEAFDLVWIGIAVYSGWRICRAPKVQLTGPFPVPGSAVPEGLQFQTVEPAASPPPISSGGRTP
jgi:hypothetical protein